MGLKEKVSEMLALRLTEERDREQMGLGRWQNEDHYPEGGTAMRRKLFAEIGTVGVAAVLVTTLMGSSPPWPETVRPCRVIGLLK